MKLQGALGYFSNSNYNQFMNVHIFAYPVEIKNLYACKILIFQDFDSWGKQNKTIPLNMSF